jgi:peptidoglycan/xylan/chitin deacetylase (PgdA/CDA1 family)
MELGNHTQTHADLSKLSPLEIQNEIAQTDELLSRVDKKQFHLFRAPYGKIDERVKTQVSTPIINWTIDTLDWLKQDETYIYDRVQAEKFAGAIVLMHDGYPPTVSALKRLLPDLKAAGYQVVSVSAMIKAHGQSFKKGVEYIRATKKNGNA